MKAIWYEKGALQTGPVDDPTPREQEVVIAVEAFALNRADLLQRQGKYPPPAGESQIPGLEAAGTILSAPSASAYRVGDRVMTLLGSGGYAEKVAVNEGLVMPVPASLSIEQAAAIPEAFLTAHHNLFTLGRTVAGEAVLVHAGASGVGTAAIQLLQLAKAVPLVTVGSEEKAAFCRALGAEAINYRTHDFAREVERLTSNLGVSVILDCVGGSYLQKNLEALGIQGRLVCIGTMGGVSAELNFRVLFAKRAQIIGSTLRALPLAQKAAIVRRFREFAEKALGTPKLHPIVHRVFPAAQIAEAQAEMEANRNIGKIVLSWTAR